MKSTHLLVPACLLVFAACDASSPNDSMVEPGAYTVTAPELIVHASADGEPLGRLYRGEVMDVHHVDENGWAYGRVGGAIDRCVWAKFSEQVPRATILNFNEDEVGEHAGSCELEPGAADSDEVRATFASRVSDDGETGTATLISCERASYWKNWDWASGAGLGPADGTLEPGDEVWWQYVTLDGNGVMAEIGGDDWVFIAAPCVPLDGPIQ